MWLLGRPIDPWRGIRFAPTIVMFSGGEKERVAPRVLRQVVPSPELQELRREVGMVALRDQAKAPGMTVDDQEVAPRGKWLARVDYLEYPSHDPTATTPTSENR